MVCDVIKAAILTATPRTSFTRLAPKIGMTYDRLNNIANGRTVPTEEDVNRIRSGLRLPKTWPYDTVRVDGVMPGEKVSLAGTRMGELPIAGSAAAGAGLWNVDVERKVVQVPHRLAEISDQGYIVDGDSMMPYLHEGYACGFKKRAKPKHGHIFLLKHDRDGYMVKGLVYDRGDWYVSSYNPSYPKVLLPANTQIVGILVGYYGTKGTRELMEIDPEGLVFELPIA
jgi:SOS-response transcriptional repressor LexA